MAKFYSFKSRWAWKFRSFLTTNWDLCVWCQEETVEMLKSPANSARGTKGAGYKNLPDNIEAFDKINSLFGSFKMSRLDEGQHIEATVRRHKAKWHDSCRIQFNKTKLKSAERRKYLHKWSRLETLQICSMSKEHTAHSTEICFFCGRCGAGDVLHNASTFDVDFLVRQCALKLEDKPLLAKLSAGHLIAEEASTFLSISPLCCRIRHGIPKQQNHMWTVSTVVSHLLGLSPILRKYVWIVLS